MLEIRNVTKSYGSHLVLQGVNLRMEPGVWMGLAGRNGCGKSTLLKIVAQICHPDSGEILCGSENILGNRPFLREKIGYVLQKDSLCSALTAQQLFVGTVSHEFLLSVDPLNKKFEEFMGRVGNWNYINQIPFSVITATGT